MSEQTKKSKPLYIIYIRICFCYLVVLKVSTPCQRRLSLDSCNAREHLALNSLEESATTS